MHLYCFFNQNRTKSVQAVKQFTAHFDQLTHINTFEDLAGLKNQTIAVFGGDGTFHNLVNAIDFSNRLVLIPCGSGNDFIRNFEALSMTHLKEAFAQNKAHRIGLLKVNEVYGLNAAGFFYDAQVAKTANESKKKLGTLVYFVAALKHIFSYKPQRVLVNNIPQNLLMLSFGNGAYAGGGFSLFPGAKPTDFRFMLLQIGSIHILQRLAYLVLVSFGKHHKISNIHLSTAMYASIKSEAKLMAEIDGETYELENEVSVNYVPDALSVLVAKVN
ncbi:MAG: diacylglycerol kinase family protein [Bacteroidia bacterium]|nr:diacylglycerol kinase family protein [Bacteroidia bacterium]